MPSLFFAPVCFIPTPTLFAQIRFDFDPDPGRTMANCPGSSRIRIPTGQRVSSGTEPVNGQNSPAHAFDGQGRGSNHLFHPCGPQGVLDTLPPVLLSLEVENDRCLSIRLSEPLTGPEASHFLLEPSGIHPDSLVNGGLDLKLFFQQPIPNRVPMRLVASGLCDLYGNCLDRISLSFTRNEARWGEVVFNELMVDPDPPVRLPDEEYVELLNRSGFPADLEGWSLHVNNRVYLLSEAYTGEEDSLRVLPGAYLVLRGMNLPNAGALLSLYNREGALIHVVRYSMPVDGAEWKMEGGYSLEAPDPDLVCNTSYQWEFSLSSLGGTPGTRNSNRRELEDLDPPVFLFAGRNSEDQILLQFNEPLEADTDRVDWVLWPGGAVPGSVSMGKPFPDYIELRFGPEELDRKEYQIRVPPLGDCSGNLTGKFFIHAGLTGEPRPGDLLINEVMFDPEVGKSEYIEVMVAPGRYLDLVSVGLQISGKESPEGGTGGPVPLSTGSRIVEPGSLLILTRNVPGLMKSYDLEPSGRWVEVKGMGSLNNSGGVISITDRAGNVLERITYLEEMHLPLVSDPKGISLERSSSEVSGSDPSNWHSAASSVGYATPGEKNSQTVTGPVHGGFLAVEPEVFSPGNDGYQDQQTIRVAPGSPGWVIRLWVTDLKGRVVRLLASLDLAGTEGTYFWDGEDDSGNLVPDGFYLLHLWAYHPGSGEQKRFRKAVGVTGPYR